MQAYSEDALGQFYYAIRNPLTKDRYEKRLDLFLKWAEIEGSTLDKRASNFATKAQADPIWCTNTIIRYLHYQRERAERKEISVSTLPNYYKPIKLFCEQNDILLNWKKITRGIPRGKSYASDRAPSLEEIRIILAYPDRRMRPAVLVMVSSGIRLGAWDYLRWGHVEPINEGDEIVSAKMIAYFGTPDQYTTFITPEGYRALEQWMSFREQHGERISKESWVMRDLWDATSKAKRGLASVPKQLKSSGLKRLIERALWAQSLRKPLEKGKKRHEFQADHGFRKFFKTQTERAMKSLHVEILMGHSVGLADNYYRVSADELLQSYKNAIPYLTISKEEQVRADLQASSEETARRLVELEGAKLALEERLDKMEQETKELKDLVVKLVETGSGGR